MPSRLGIGWRGSEQGRVRRDRLRVVLDSVLKSIDLPASVTDVDGVKPNVMLDSGVPIIVATERIANAIYGALGIGPASDGNCECTVWALCVCAGS